MTPVGLVQRRDILASIVKEANYCLTERAYAAVADFFLSPDATAEHLTRIAPEFGRSEYFLIMNPIHNGWAAPHVPSSALLRRFESDAGRLPLLGQAFQEAKVEGDTILLVNRWLAHFAGFRHRVVHLFLDHATREDYFYVQLRSFSKANAPGRFDVAVGGHVVGIAHENTAVVSEVNEELGIDATRDMSPPTLLGRYDYCGFNVDDEFINVESRSVYRARLLPGVFDGIHFPDGEVAGLCLMARGELLQLIKRNPSGIASGLRESLAHYEAAVGSGRNSH